MQGWAAAPLTRAAPARPRTGRRAGPGTYRTAGRPRWCRTAAGGCRAPRRTRPCRSPAAGLAASTAPAPRPRNAPDAVGYHTGALSRSGCRLAQSWPTHGHNPDFKNPNDGAKGLHHELGCHVGLKHADICRGGCTRRELVLRGSRHSNSGAYRGLMTSARPRAGRPRAWLLTMRTPASSISRSRGTSKLVTPTWRTRPSACSAARCRAAAT